MMFGSHPHGSVKCLVIRIALLQPIVAVAGIVIGTTALYAALTEADAVRKQQEPSVWFLLQVAIDNYGMKTKEPVVQGSAGNAGIGLAMAATFYVTVEGDARTNWNDVFKVLEESRDDVPRACFSRCVPYA